MEFQQFCRTKGLEYSDIYHNDTLRESAVVQALALVGVFEKIPT